MIWINVLCLVGLWIFGFLTGRLKKQEAYEKKLEALEADKEYWRGIACKRIPDPPSL